MSLVQRLTDAANHDGDECEWPALADLLHDAADALEGCIEQRRMQDEGLTQLRARLDGYENQHSADPAAASHVLIRPSVPSPEAQGRDSSDPDSAKGGE
jgi:hypothetical protein